MREAQRPSCKFGTPQISETIRARKLKFYTPLDGTIPIFGNEFFSPGDVRMAHRPTVNLGPPHIWEIIRARKLKFYKHLDESSAPFGNDIFFRKGRLRGAVRPNVNLNPFVR